MIGVLSGTEFLVVLLAVTALVAMGVASLVGIWTRLRRGVVHRTRPVRGLSGQERRSDDS